MKSISQQSNILTPKMKLRGISFLLLMFPCCWHASQLVTNALASLNIVGHQKTFYGTLESILKVTKWNLGIHLRPLESILKNPVIYDVSWSFSLENPSCSAYFFLNFLKIKFFLFFFGETIMNQPNQSSHSG